MHDLFNDPEANNIFGIAGYFPLTMSKEEVDTPPALGQVIDWDANGNIFSVVEVNMVLSYN
jgi:hypothetical protein